MDLLITKKKSLVLSPTTLILMGMVLATHDPEPLNPGADADTDNDGIIDSLDEDDDGDGYSDAIEDELGTDSKDPDDTPEDQEMTYCQMRVKIL